MITLPPSEDDLHAYVDDRLTPDERRQIECYLASHADLRARVRGWQADAHNLRTALAGDLQRPSNPQLSLASIRHQRRQRTGSHLARAAMLVLALGIGGIGGWQGHRMIAVSPGVAPMTDALQAYRLFAQQDIMPADFTVEHNADLQAWLDRYFTDARRLPDLASAGFRAVSARLLSTDQGPAAMVLYQDNAGRRVSFYVRPPGENHGLLPRGTRRDGELQADYWSGPGYNYAMVIPVGNPATAQLRQAIGATI
jgi:anti-sigma factor RsiW